MSTDIIKQEILLMITPFSKKKLCEKNASGRRPHQSDAEQLEEACWNGLLDEFLGNIIEKTASGKRLCLWNIQPGKSYLVIELFEEHPQSTEKYLSIVPYSFLPMVFRN